MTYCCNHTLNFYINYDNFCNYCKIKEHGKYIYGCRLCNFDLCIKCYINHPKKVSELDYNILLNNYMVEYRNYLLGKIRFEELIKIDEMLGKQLKSLESESEESSILKFKNDLNIFQINEFIMNKLLLKTNEYNEQRFNYILFLSDKIGFKSLIYFTPLDINPGKN